MMIQGVSDGGPDGATSGALMGVWSADSFFRTEGGGGGFARAQELEPWLDLVAVRGGGGAVLAQAGGEGGVARGGGGTAGGADTGAVEEVFVKPMVRVGRGKKNNNS